MKKIDISELFEKQKQSRFREMLEAVKAKKLSMRQMQLLYAAEIYERRKEYAFQPYLPKPEELRAYEAVDTEAKKKIRDDGSLSKPNVVNFLNAQTRRQQQNRANEDAVQEAVLVFREHGGYADECAVLERQLYEHRAKDLGSGYRIDYASKFLIEAENGAKCVDAGGEDFYKAGLKGECVQ